MSFEVALPFFLKFSREAKTHQQPQAPVQIVTLPVHAGTPYVHLEKNDTHHFNKQYLNQFWSVCDGKDIVGKNTSRSFKR